MKVSKIYTSKICFEKELNFRLVYKKYLKIFKIKKRPMK